MFPSGTALSLLRDRDPMTDTLKPQNAKDVEDAVGWALAEGKTLEIAGQGSKRGLGRPSQSDLTLDLSALSGVTLYEPEELVLSAKAVAANNHEVLGGVFEEMQGGRVGTLGFARR